MVTFVYFDVGGVVILDFSGTDKWEKLKKELGVTPEKDGEFEILWNHYEDMVCIGKYSVEELIPIFNKKLGLRIPEDHPLLIEGFVSRFEKNKSIWPVIDAIHKKCRVGLLTNMYPRMLNAIQAKDLMPQITWDEVIDSSVVGLKKPDPEIYKLAEEKAQVAGSEILFIENSAKNIEGAQKFDWQTFLYDSKNPDKSSTELLRFFDGVTN